MFPELKSIKFRDQSKKKTVKGKRMSKESKAISKRMKEYWRNRKNAEK